MIVYIDSSVLVRAYLADELGHKDVAALLEDPEIGAITGTWTLIEVSGALVRAARTGRGDAEALLAAFDSDVGLDGSVTVIAAPRGEIEEHALRIVREHAVRAMDAWHLAVATLTVPALAEPGERSAFATRDDAQAAVAESLGFVAI